MTKENQISLMVGGVALLAAVIVVRYYVVEYFYEEQVPACGVVASSAQQLNVKAPSGRLMTPIQLQTEIGMSAPGVIDHARVVNVSDAPPEVAVEISLPEGAGSPIQSKSPLGGVAFLWQPAGMGSANTACLRYALKIPSDFQPGDGGALPGLFGGTIPPMGEQSDGTTGFAIRTLWRDDGELEIYAQFPSSNVSNPALLKRDSYKFAQGKWVWIDQEVVLNTSGQLDGAYRLWIDGEMAYENKKITWRADDSLHFGGVSANVHYGRPLHKTAVAPVSTVIGISPFQLSWN